MDSANIKAIFPWDMSTKDARQIQVKRDFFRAYNLKMPTAEFFKELDDYYNNKHYSQDKVVEMCTQNGYDFTPPCLTDPYIQVESLVDPNRPDFTFKPRNLSDVGKAQERQELVEYVVYNTRVDDMMTGNERTLNKLGNAFWKVAFDGSIQGPGYMGEIAIGDPDPANIFPLNPNLELDDQEMIFYPYLIHRRAARRIWGSVVDDIVGEYNAYMTEIYNKSYEYVTPQIIDEDMLQVIETWYKDDEGDIACSIQINYTEVQFIPKYWNVTRHSGNKLYPFVKYCKIPVNKSFWDKGEIEAIKDLVDAEDMEFLQALLNDGFSSNDIILEEENTRIDEDNISVTPGARWQVREGCIEKIKRLGGMANNTNAIAMINFINERIQETNGNFNLNQGDAPPPNINTLGGMQLLDENGNKRIKLKKADRANGFKRLYELIDWTALEFYNQDRVILIRTGIDYNEKNADAIQSGQLQPKQTSFTFNSENHKKFDRDKYVGLMENQIQKGVEVTPEMEQGFADASNYFPKLDTEIIISSPIEQSKAYTSQATQMVLSEMDNLNPAKAALLKSQVENMGLPNQQEIDQAIDKEAMWQQQQQVMQAQMQQQQVQNDTLRSLPSQNQGGGEQQQ